MTTQRKRQSQRRVADDLFSKLVRSVGYCEAEGRILIVEWELGEAAHQYDGTGVTSPHAGPLQCAHVFSRSYIATRFERMNAVCLCAAHHVYFTHRPLEWEDWCREQLGSAVYDELRRTALRGGRPSYPELIADLRRQLGGAAA